VKELLVILNPREIESCLRSYEELDIDQLFLKRMTEIEIGERWKEVMELAKGYDWLWIQSDDGIVRQHALDAVRFIRTTNMYECVTGYSNLTVHASVVNMSMAPLPDFPTPAWQRTWMSLSSVMTWPTWVINTQFAGFALTGMSLELWKRYPYNPDLSADFNLSRRLKASKIKIAGVRDALVWHLKGSQTFPLLTDGPSEMVLET